MGQVISSKAAADDIFADIKTTQVNAAARGGKWQELSDQRLTPVSAVVGNLLLRIAAAENDLLPLRAAVDAQDIHSDKFIGQLSDEIWNDIGRPAYDPTYDCVFPGGIAYYTGGADEEQPDRMDLLADLLEMNLISKLDPAKVTDMVQRLRAETETYRQTIAAFAKPSKRLQQTQRAKTAVAQCARMELAHLKRLYKAAGFSEADIHTVIPDHPRTKKAAAVQPTQVQVQQQQNLD